jgi:hypothetical protein
MLQFSNNRGKTGFAKVVFPNPQAKDAIGFQDTHISFVAGPVSFNFTFPKWRSSGGYVAASRTSVPKAPVHEQGNLLLRKEEIGFTCDCWMENPAFDASSHERHPQQEFGALVAFATDRGHNSGATWRDTGEFPVF